MAKKKKLKAKKEKPRVIVAPLPRILKPPPMTGQQYQMAIDVLGLTQEESGVWLGMTGRQGQRYANGIVEVPGPVRLLLRHMLRRKFKPQDIST